MLGQLVPCGGGKAIPLRAARLFLGRKIEGDPHSGRQCELRWSGTRWTVIDHGMPDGIWVNGTQIREQVIEPHDVLRIGKHRYRIEYDLSEPADAGLTAPVPQKPTPSAIPTARLRVVKPPEPASRVAGEEQIRTGDGQAKEPLPDSAGARPLSPAGVSAAGGGLTGAESSGTGATPTEKSAGETATPGNGLQTAAGEGGSYLGCLIPCAGGKPIPLIQPRLTAGRDAGCGVVLPFHDVSSLHCGLELVDSYWRVIDLGSLNGVRVEGLLVRRKWVRPGEVISFATRRYRLEYFVPDGVPPPADDGPDFSLSLMQQAGMAAPAHHRTPPRTPPPSAPGDTDVKRGRSDA